MSSGPCSCARSSNSHACANIRPHPHRACRQRRHSFVTFLSSLFGLVEVYRQDGFAQLQTPGARDVFVLEENPERAGKIGGVAHFGFRLKSPDDIARARSAVELAGGQVRETGEFVPGEPYLFALDPDGYEFEIWFEIPTAVDP